MARLFAASSPTTTCSSVMIRKATITATGSPRTARSGPKTLSSSEENAGSPSTPRPRLATVIPSWQAAR
jgi:hypothetical protein